MPVTLDTPEQAVDDVVVPDCPSEPIIPAAAESPALPEAPHFETPGELERHDLELLCGCET